MDRRLQTKLVSVFLGHKRILRVNGKFSQLISSSIFRETIEEVQSYRIIQLKAVSSYSIYSKLVLGISINKLNNLGQNSKVALQWVQGYVVVVDKETIRSERGQQHLL